MDNYLYSDLDYAEIIGDPDIRETPDGMYAVAHCYLNGKGIESNYDAYLDYLKQAASIGSQRAKEELEEIEEKKQQEEELEENFLDEEDDEASFEEMSDEAFGNNVEDSPTPEGFSRYASATEGLTVVKGMSTVDLYEEAGNDNPYACLELYYRTKKGKNKNQVLATQCLDKATIIAEQERDPEFCRIVFKEAGEYYANKDLDKSLDYLGKASELGDSSASLRLARYYLSEKGEDKDQALRYLELAGSGETNEDTYEIARAYLECGNLLKGKSLFGRLLKQDNIDQNLWFQCALLCPEFTTTEGMLQHAWAVKKFTPDVQMYLLNYYEANPESADLDLKRVSLFAKWEYDINGACGPWMQRAADLGVEEAIAMLEANSGSSVNESLPDNVEVSSILANFSRYATVAEGLTDTKGMSTMELYEEAENGNPYAHLELYYRTQNNEDGDQVLAAQCLDKVVSIAEQEENPEFCRIVFKEAGEYYVDKNLEKSLHYLEKASELGDSSASLRLARYYLSIDEKGRDYALRYLELAGSGETDEDTYEIARTYLECGDQLKGKNLLGRLLRQENIDQNLWFQCAQICPELTTTEEMVHHAWAVKDFTPDVQTYLLDYYEVNWDSVDLNSERIFLLAKWEREIDGTSGHWMQRAADQGVAEATDILETERLAKEKEEKDKEERQKRQEEKKRKEQEEEQKRQEEERIKQEEERIRKEEEKRRIQEEEERQEENNKRIAIIAIIAAIVMILFISHPKIFVVLLIILIIVFLIWRHNQQ